MVLCAAVVLAVGAASASATTITSNGVLYTGTIHAVSVGHVELHNPAANLKCNSTITGTIETHSDVGTAHGPIDEWTFSNCTEAWTFTVNAPGWLEIHTDASDPNGTTGNGTVTSTGATITGTNDTIGITCRYKTNATDMGTLTGSRTTDGTPILHIEASIPFHSGSIFCGSGASAWTGTYEITTPMNLDVDHPV
jgi:hypothetical protein